jgi:O-antigen/teichoic acid export membrane protein
MHDMNRKISAGVLWNLVSMLLSRGSATIFMLFLARFLAPESFGLIAMMMIVLELAHHFVQSGLGQALIRSKVVSEEDLSTIFYANLGLSTLTYAGVYWCAPYLAEFYDQAQLIDMLRIMGLVVFFNAMKVVPLAILSRRMNFRLQMMAETTSVLISGVVAVIMAWQGAGVWSLVGQSMAMAACSALLLWYVSSWTPRLQFSLESFRRLFSFGANLLLIGTIRILVENSYVIVIGRFFSAEVTGLYFLARKVSQMIPQQLSGAVQKATFPAMATLQDDNVQLRCKYRQIIQLMMFMMAPIMALLAALAEPLFAVLLGDKWSGAVVYMQLLCIVATLYPLHAMNINVLNVKGRSDLVLKIGLLKNACSIFLLFVTLPYGVFWIVIGQVANSVLSLIPNTYFTVRLIDYGIKQQVLDIAKPVVAAAVAGGATFCLINFIQWSDIFLLVAGGALGVAVFLVASHILGVEALKMLLTKRRSLYTNFN